MAKVTGKWARLASSSNIQRSSHVIGVLNNKLLIYGGEFKPREPVDDKVYSVPLSGNSSSVQTLDMGSDADVPAARVGAASTTVGNAMYVFSGRGGASMKPMDEAGSLWCLSSDPPLAEHEDVDPKAVASSTSWSLIGPQSSVSVSPPASRDGNDGNSNPSNCASPEARSYHAMTSDNSGTIYLHAGCPPTGRLSDLWAFQLQARKWIRLADAPAPPRGGTSIAFAHKENESCGKLYRLNGFDGKNEQGGAIDVYDLETDHWNTMKFTPDGVEGPEPRSVGCLLSVNVTGRESLVTFGGERDPSSLGHEGAGKMLGDIWIWDLTSSQWTQVETDGESPCPRGWFAADAVRGADGKDAVVVQGGLDEQNQRLGDVWMLTFQES